MAAAKPPPSSLRALCLGLSLFLLLVGVSRAQAPAPTPSSGTTQPRTDPTEARAVNAIFRRWSLTANGWNISGELCSGVATDSSNSDDSQYNPTIKCVCTYDGGGTCHVTRLKIYALNVVGTFPQEIQNLTYLTNLNLAQNYLTGPLPAFIGNLTAMQYMTFGINALSGPLPKELGNLRNLVSLGMGSNNFNGSLPSEFGKLTNLEELYMDSSGVSGEIPPSLSTLRKLRIIWASDNDLTGRIPDFVGTWTNLTVLRFQGNSFQGPIPSSLANLTLLTDLRIGDILNGSSSLDFIRNMSSLSTLIIRNSRISDNIPQSFAQFTKMQLLDLSFNNLTGQLPLSLFNLGQLQFLFLGNNSLSGSLPTRKSTSLQNIDLSYNQLSGAFPTWASEQNLKLNLVANNFVFNDSNRSVLASGLECLQRDVPCNRGFPIYSSFGIKCGGKRSIAASDTIMYEVDDQNLTTASYYVTDTMKWGVSSTGRFSDSLIPSYTSSVLKQFPNTLDTELFQTARLSPSSLRYYGLGLENGNYTIKLQFSETAYPDTSTWQSVGRRVFDIYIQGVLREPDFDIRKTAGGSFLAVVRNYDALVTNNFLEIHFFWAGKGTCCIPTQGYYGPAVSAVSVTPNFQPTVSNRPRSSASGKNNTGLVVGLAVGTSVFCFFLVLFFVWRQRRKRSSWHDDEELLGISSRADMLSYAELRTATEDFGPANKLGEGGFGPVFKGKLSDGRVVAVKQLLVASNQGKAQFVAEISTISAVQHKHLVKLYGCCVDGDKRLLVYEYLENKSLDQMLFGKHTLKLGWSTRFEICLGTARGLAYLHEESRIRIVHRDVKASNILLDADLNPKISDFGLAKLYDDKKTHISTRVAGTIGYLAPEYAMRGHLTEKADVFGFGVVALEILSGRPNSDTSLPQEKAYLLEWAWLLHENNHELEMVDPTLSSYSKDEALRMFGVALLCTQSAPSQRPSMSRVVAMLAGDVEVGAVTSKPAYLTDWQFDDITNTFTGTDYSSTSPLQTTTSSEAHMSSQSSSMAGLQPSHRPTDPILHEGITDGR